MKIKREYVIAGFAWSLLIGIAVFVAPSFIALFDRKDSPKPFPIEKLVIDKELSLFYQPTHQNSHEPVSCWYQIHGMQGKSGPHHFFVECEVFLRLKERLTPPKPIASKPATTIPVAPTSSDPFISRI